MQHGLALICFFPSSLLGTMAGWLSSKLRVAEQFLQQIDQHAAESLGKAEKEISGDVFTSKLEERSQKRSKEPLNSEHGNQSNIFGHGIQEENQLISSGLRTPTTSTYGQKEISRGKMHPSREQYVKEIRQSSRIGRSVDLSDLANKEDWTELLSSADLSSSSLACMSSVGSSDTATIMDVSSRTPFFTGRSGSYMGNSESVTKPFYSHLLSSEIAVSQVKPAKVFSKDEGMNLTKQKRLSNLEQDSARRRLYLDTKDIEILDSGFKIRAAEDADKTECIEFEAAKGKDMIPHTNNKTVLEDRKPVFSSMSGTFKGIGKDGDANPELVSCKDAIHTYGTHGRCSDLEVQNKADLYIQKDPSTTVLQHDVNFVESSPKLDNRCIEADHNGAISPTVVKKEASGIGLGGAEKLDFIKRESIISPHKFTTERNEFIDQKNGSTVDVVDNMSSDLQAEKHVYGNRLVQVPDELSVVENAVKSVSLLDSDLENSGSRTETDTDTETTSDSDNEDADRSIIAQRRRIAKQKELATAAVKAAVDAIKMREDFVEKLENEKQILEQTLVDYQQNQVKQATELHLSMMEVAQALELEKQQHSSARMKALAKESQLENENAKLANSLAAAQRSLEEEISQVAEARNLIEAREIAHTDFERKIAALRHKLFSQHIQETEFAKKANLEEPSFEEEQADLWQKIEQCQIKVKGVEERIGALRSAQYARTDAEIQLESRLVQLTDQLIQKQAQVEALSTEKATLVFRLEALSTECEDERSAVSLHAPRTRGAEWGTFSDDLEHGFPKSYHSKNKLFLSGNDKGDAISGGVNAHSLLPFFRQLDILFSAGVYFLRRHRWAQAFVLVYLLLLHLWVVFVLFMHSQPDIAIASRDLRLPLSGSDFVSKSNYTNSFV